MLRGMAVVELVVVALVSGWTVHAQTQGLTDNQIAAAIANGTKTKADKIGLVLKLSRWEDLKRSTKINRNTFDETRGNYWSGLTLVAFTPQTWIEELAAKAKAQYQNFTATDVNDEMRRPVLRIFANTQSVDRVVVRSADKSAVVQPTAIVPCPKEGMYFGNDESSSAPDCRGFEFSLDEIRKLQAASKDGELIVTSIFLAVSDEVEFKVERKNLSKLPM